MVRPMNIETPLKHLTDHGIKPSMQRLAVMGYLMHHHTHPTADKIYSALHPEMPTLSKTTVYNTLKLLVEQGAANQVNIDDRTACFDVVTVPHAHFLCNRCGKIFDVPLQTTDLRAVVALPKGFSADQSALYFRGICKHCAEKEAQRLASHNKD